MVVDDAQARSAAGEGLARPGWQTTTQTTKRLAAVVAASGALGTLSACNDQELGPPTPEDAASYLAQAGLGATQAGIDQVVQLGYGGWLDQQFAMPVSESLWTWMLAHGFNAATYKASDMGMDQALWCRLLNAPDVLRQRVVLALSQIFVVSVRNMPVPWGQFACVAYWELLEANCLGNFRTLLERIALSPAMGTYLSMRGSRKEDAQGRQPDENFARELLQLFTIGLVQLNADGSPQLDANGQTIDTYSSEDIQGLARVFTGWDFDGFDPNAPDYTRKPMVFKAANHSTLDKTFLGKTIAGNTPGPQAFAQALDTVFMHPNVGPFLARHLIQLLVTSNPSGDYVARVAAAFNDNGQGVRGDMRAVIRAVLTDGEPRLGLSPLPVDMVGKLREPVMRFLQWARVVKLQSSDGLWNVGDLSAADRLGQSPLRSASVFNFFRPGYVPPHSALADAGKVAPEFQITDESSVIGYANFMFRVLPYGAANVTVDYSEWLPLASDATALVDRVNLLFTGRKLLATTVTDMVTAVGTIPLSNPQGAMRRVVSAMLLVLCSPEFLVQR